MNAMESEAEGCMRLLVDKDKIAATYSLRNIVYVFKNKGIDHST